MARTMSARSSARLPSGALTMCMLLACSGAADSRTPATPTPTIAADPAPPDPQPSKLVDPRAATLPAPTTAAASNAPAIPLPVAPTPDARGLQFTRACVPGDTATIAAVGDLLLHHELQIQAYAAPEGFLAVWGEVRDLLALADLSYANLEGAVATGLNRKGEAVTDPGKVFDNKVYSSYPRFNYHASLLDDLLGSGIDVVSTANNHALDREPAGVDATIAALDRVGLAHTGTRARGAATPWHTITAANGLKVAWLACTFSTNQIPDPDHQVLGCFKPEGALEREVSILAADPAIDAVIVTPHWGVEYTPTPARPQQKLARKLAEAGATAVIGSHPHVLQTWEVIRTQDGREVPVVYSLGNFASHQPGLPRRSSMILYLGLTRPAGAKAHVHGVRYVPLHVRRDGERYFVEAIDRVGGPADSRALTVGVFGEAAVLAPGAPLATRPACP
jgi:poly-gamma-glutamate synthesis protein (capsule biosynthesis protein)